MNSPAKLKKRQRVLFVGYDNPPDLRAKGLGLYLYDEEKDLLNPEHRAEREYFKSQMPGAKPSANVAGCQVPSAKCQGPSSSSLPSFQ